MFFRSVLLILVATIAVDTAFGAGKPRKIKDAQIVAILLAASQGEVEAGKLAEKAASSTEVREYGAIEANDHASIIREGEEVLRRLGVESEENATSGRLRSTKKATMTMLLQAEKHDFDKAYIDHEIAFHILQLNEVRHMLAPSSKNQDVREMLARVTLVIETHLKAARKLRKKLAGEKKKKKAEGAPLNDGH